MTDRDPIQTRVNALPTDIQYVICRFEHNVAFRECLESITARPSEYGVTVYENAHHQFFPRENGDGFFKPTGSYIIEKILNIKNAFIEDVEIEEPRYNSRVIQYRQASEASVEAGRAYQVTMYEMLCIDAWAQESTGHREQGRSSKDYHEPGDEDPFWVLAFKVRCGFQVLA